MISPNVKKDKTLYFIHNYSVSFLNKRKFYKYKIHFLQTFGIREPESHGRVIVGHLWRFSRNDSSFSISSAESLKVMIKINYTGRGYLIHPNQTLVILQWCVFRPRKHNYRLGSNVSWFAFLKTRELKFPGCFLVCPGL